MKTPSDEYKIKESGIEYTKLYGKINSGYVYKNEEIYVDKNIYIIAVYKQLTTFLDSHLIQ